MEENWEEFPLFAPEGVQVPKVADGNTAEDISPALGALSHLLYDEESPEEVSEHLRENGNRLFRRGKRAAVEKYTEAIDANCDIPEVMAAAYSNRAAAELKMKNYGRCLADCESSLELQPSNIKARYRGAISALAIQRFDKALLHCDKGLLLCQGSEKRDRDNSSLFRQTKLKVEKQKEIAASKLRKMDEKRTSEEKENLNRMKCLQKRGVTLGLPLFAQQRRYNKRSLSVTDHGLSWPVLLLYPEEAVGMPGIGDQSDYLEDVHEDTTLLEILRTVFPGQDSPEWDKRGVYKDFSKLEVLFRADWTMTEAEADSDDEASYVGSTRGPDEVGSWRSLSSTSSLRQALATSGYVVPLFPVFYVVPTGVYLS